MAEDEHISPRVAIRSWLQDAAAGPGLAPHATKAKLPSRHNSRRRSHALVPGESKRYRSPQSNVGDGIGGKTELPKISSTLMQPKSENLNLAERLGLHAPFRRIQDHVDNISSADFEALPRGPKRRHRKSSTDSHLEPANIEMDKKHERELRHADVTANISAEPLTDSVANLSPLEKRPVAYKRRKRHKTRDDHYDLKEDGGISRRRNLANKNTSGRKQKPRKRKEKSGAALLHDFAAQNVSQDRLTVSCCPGGVEEPSCSHALVATIKSSRLLRKGQGFFPIPDLAFSETTFLNSRRGKLEDVIKASTNEQQKKKKNRTSTKAADTEAEISRYFTQAQATVPNTKDNDRQQRQHGARNMCRAHDSPPEFVDLPKTPFLGFGSCGANSISPVKHSRSPGIGEPEIKSTQSSKRSSSYLTWSQSAAPSQSSYHAHISKVMPEETSILPDRNAKSPASDPSRSSHPPQSSPPNQKASANEHRDVNHSVSKGESDSKCHSWRNDALHPRETQMSRVNAFNDVQEERPTDDNDKPAGEGASSKPIVPARKSDDMSPRNETAIPSNVCLVQGERDVSPRATSTRPQVINRPLDDALEALLREYRAQHTVCATQSPLPQPVLTNPNDQPLADGIGDQLLKHPSRSSGYAHHAPTSSLRTQDRAGRSAESGDIPSSRESRDYRVHTQGSLHTIPRQKTISPLRFPREVTSSAPHISESKKGDSRSAWTGYDTIYERQQSLQYLDRATDEEYDYDHQYRSHNGRNMVRETRHGSQSYDQDECHFVGETENIRGTASTLDEETRCMSWDEPFAHYRDRVSHEGCHDDDEDLLAEYEGVECKYHGIESKGDDLQSHGMIEDLESCFKSDHMSAEGLQAACEPDWRNSSNNIVAKEYAADWMNPMNRKVNTDDGALSRFWTPQKLY